MLFLSPAVKSSVLLETVVHYRLCSYILGVSVFKYTSACAVIKIMCAYMCYEVLRNFVKDTRSKLHYHPGYSYTIYSEPVVQTWDFVELATALRQ